MIKIQFFVFTGTTLEKETLNILRQGAVVGTKWKDSSSRVSILGGRKTTDTGSSFFLGCCYAHQDGK
jgi:hypothetical protein